MPRPLSDANKRKVIAMDAVGDDVYKISAAIPCSHMTVRRVLGTQPTEKKQRNWKTVRDLA